MGRIEVVNNAILDTIWKNASLLKQLTGKAKEKEYDVDLVSNCVVAMGSDQEATVEAEGISDAYYIKQNRSYTSPVEMTPAGICVYASGTVKTAKELIDRVFNIRYVGNCGNLSVHAIINYTDGKIYQTLPWNYKGDHQFSDLDDSYVGVVICEANACSLDNDPMVDTFDSLVVLAAWLCNKYDIAPNEKTIILQNDTGRISDVSSYWQGFYSKEEFYSKVLELMKTDISKEKLQEAFYAS